ncbi:hypothetical protein M0208_06110 [Sphingomonas sp. SUN019]|uniref:hypothetical protein n=1 Tax=Sphingomonas sp. SUN019 TaxID=2937788 RepID=UPI002164E949|nr:hypothetical protein [Sphingomonas sp. SUN019]UVO50111.1 hypothetical protein M0208_06110 [Sphingomonas sp. SUN019]
MIAMTAACSNYPDDIAGTSEHVRASRTIRVGIVASGQGHADATVIDVYLARIETVTGARRLLKRAAAEPLLASLENGDLDIVIGEFADDTPWLTEVAFVDPLAERVVGKRTIILVPVARNGENRWIMLLEKAVRESEGL